MKKLLLLFILIQIGFVLFAQTYNMPTGTGSASYITCNATFYDSGGLNGNYGLNQNSNIKFTPTNPGFATKISFTSFVVGEGATMSVYNGPDASYQLIAVYNDLISPVGLQIVASPAPLNPDGSIYIQFTSTTHNEVGWMASVTCGAPCQSFNVQIDPMVTSKPIVEDIYMNVCKDSCITFGAEAIFLQNNINYNQTQANTKFIWRFGYTAPDTIPIITQCFEQVRGWDYLLYAVDTMGCFSNTYFKGRVRVSGNPISGSYPYQRVCSGSDFNVNAGYDPMSTVTLGFVGSAISGTLSKADTVFLPDGSNISYESNLLFDIFDPGQTLSNINHLLGVKMTLEHSYCGDLSIRLTCPNGGTALLKAFGSPTPPAGINLSCSSGGANTQIGSSIDNSQPACMNTPGIGYDYEFRPGATNCFGTGGPTVGFSYVDPCGHDNGAGGLQTLVPSVPNAFTATPTVPTYYGNYENLSPLMGCPLNGNWKITVTDNLGIDNGYIFSWSLSLDQSIIPGGWEYTVGADTVIWTGPGIVNPTSKLSAIITANQVGVNQFLATVIDEYGCAYDTTFTVETVQSPIPLINQGLDTVRMCAGDIMILNANYQDPEAEYWWNTGSSTDEIMTLVEGLYSITITAETLDGSLICTGSDSIYVSVNPHPMPDFDVDKKGGCAPLNLQFENLTTPDNIPLTYSWHVFNADGQEKFTSTQENPEFFIEEPGKYHVQLVVSTENGCTDSLMKWNFIEIHPQPIAEFSFTPEISLMSELDGLVTFTNYCDSAIFANNPDATWYWNFDDGTVDSTQWNAIHTFSTWGDYNVMFYISTAYGCKSSIKHTVIVEQDLEFPNIITPNGDGVNDVFAIKNLNTSINPEDPDEYRTNTLHIYDRWGKKVYETENYDTYMKDEQLFVGKKAFAGEKLQDGQYYFSFYYKGKIKTVKYSGSLIIVRNN